MPALLRASTLLRANLPRHAVFRAAASSPATPCILISSSSPPLRNSRPSSPSSVSFSRRSSPNRREESSHARRISFPRLASGAGNCVDLRALSPIASSLTYPPAPRAVRRMATVAAATAASAGVPGSGPSVPEVIGRVEANGVAVITLDRPKALNAMNLDMDLAFQALLDEWSQSPAVKAVLVEGSTARAFSAGMDIKGAAKLIQEDVNTTYVPKVFSAEYRLICAISRFPKPYLSLMEGVTMGFGLGLAAHGRYRVVTERTLLAMPENAIGLFPDVGFAHIAAKSPGSGAVGTYLGMTGARVNNPADALFTGIATHYVTSDAVPRLRADLLAADFSTSPASSVIDAVLARHAQTGSAHAHTGNTKDADADADAAAAAASPPPLHSLLPAIERCFHRDACPHVCDVVKALEREKEAEEERVSHWATASLSALALSAPFSLAVTLKHLHRTAAATAQAAADAANGTDADASVTIESVMSTEYRMALRMSTQPDFQEGVRAVLIDKDKNPKWSPASVEEVDDAAVDAVFAPLPEGAGELIV